MSKDFNSAMIEKTIQTADFLSGGVLNPEQQRAFVVLIKRFATLLARARSVEMPQASMEIDKLHVSEPITRSADENVAQASVTKVKVNQIRLDTKKVRSDWNMTTESLQQSIEGNAFEMTIMRAMTNQIAQDLEMLAIMGDTAIVGADPVAVLLRRLDGWYKQALSAHVINCQGLNIQRGIFSEMKRALPKQYRSDPNLRFITSDSLITDWQNLLAGGAGTVNTGGVGSDAVAAAAFGGGSAGMTPFGIPLMKVPLIPDDMPVTVNAGANAAYLDGIRYSPFRIVVGTNNVLQINVNGGGVRTITFLENKVYDLVEICKLINDVFVANGDTAIAEDNGENKLRIRTTNTGLAATLVVSANAGPGSSTANETLGFPTAGINAAGAAAGGSVPEGSFIILTNPLNLVWGVLDGTRIFTEFNKDSDRIESVVYNQIDAKIENLDALVIATNIRRSQMLV